MAWPTTTDPREVFVTTRFTKGEAADLDVIAAVHGDRSTAIRTAIEREARRVKRAQRKLATDDNPAGA